MGDYSELGHVFNELTQMFFESYDNGKFPWIKAKDLIHWSVYGLYMCDEDETEALQDSLRCRCGCCLRKMEAGEKLYSPYFTNMSWKYITADMEWKIAYHSYCEDCLVKTFGEEAARDIMESCRGDEHCNVVCHGKGGLS